MCIELFQSHITVKMWGVGKERHIAQTSIFPIVTCLYRFKFPQGINDNIFNDLGDDLCFCVCIAAKQFQQSGASSSLPCGCAEYI